MRFAICLLLIITLLAIKTPNMCVKALTICDKIHTSSKTRFDYAFTMRTKDGDQHYIIIDGYGFQIYNQTDKALMIYDGIRSEKTDDSVLAFAYKVINDLFHVTCYYKVNIKEFVCHVDYILDINYTVNYDLFECSSKPIDLKRVIAYHPQSYSDRERNEILLVEKVVDQTNSNNQRKVWTSYWPNIMPTTGMNITCAEENDYNKSGIIPKFLSAINKSLEITAILSLRHNNTPSAMVLFYHDRQHKFCITDENQLSANCDVKTIKTYLNCEISSDATNNYRIKILIFAILDVIAITVVIIQLLVLIYILGLMKNETRIHPFSQSITSTNNDVTVIRHSPKPKRSVKLLKGKQIRSKQTLTT